MRSQSFLFIISVSASPALATSGNFLEGFLSRSGPAERRGEASIYCYDEPTGRGVVCREVGVRYCKDDRTNRARSAEAYEKVIGCISWHDCK